MQRETAMKILRDAREEERQRIELERKKKEDLDKKLEEAFERDRRNLKLIEEKGSMNAAKEFEFEAEIVNRLVKTETAISSKVANRDAQL